MSGQILYEHPLNERIRVFLRLEHLFSQVEHFKNGNSLWDHHASVCTFIELITILDRSDLRSELLKELDRHRHELSKLLNKSNIDQERLTQTLAELTRHYHDVQGLSHKLSQEIRANDLLNSLRQRTIVSGGSCGFDIPAYYYWLNQDLQKKSECFNHWWSELIPFSEGINLILTLIRKSAFFERYTASHGFFQQSFDGQNACQLLRIALNSDTRCYPEISGHKHRINLRFMVYQNTGAAQQLDTQQFDFDMSCCAI